MGLDIDWKPIAGPLTAAGGIILGSVIGGPFGAVAGPMIGKAIADALGVDPTPEAVKRALDRPESTVAVIQTQAAIAPSVLQAQERWAADMDSARAANRELSKSGSPLAFVTPALSIIIICCLALEFYLIQTSRLKDSASMDRLVDFTIFAATAVVGYWFGSSRGSAEKTAELAALARGAQAQQGGGR